jgi:hypothetical protein
MYLRDRVAAAAYSLLITGTGLLFLFILLGESCIQSIKDRVRDYGSR